MPEHVRKPFLSAEWRNLAVLNFEIDPDVLTPLLPRECELDLWNGAALISLVGFQFLDTRVLGRAIPLHRNFEEVNLRFYVTGPKDRVTVTHGRGVVFIREIVPKRAIALIANTLYGTRTFWRSTSMVHCNHSPMDQESFILEHYWGYGRSTYRVEHPSWRTRRVTAARFDVDVDSLYGPQFNAALRREMNLGPRL